MSFPVTEHVVKSRRHTTFYLACGMPQGTPIILLHGWPELSISWRHQLPVLAGLGFRALAPDMRGYGRSSLYTRHEDYALQEVVADMLELLDAIGGLRAIWVGHDWGSPVAWSMAQHHSDRCHGVASLCVPYMPAGFTAENVIPLCDRRVYPEDQFPAAQWDYQLFYRENFAAACAGFEGNVRATVRALFRRGDPAGKGKPARTASVRAHGGWFGGRHSPPALPRDEAVLSEEDEHRYVAALERKGFFGPDSWYMNGAANAAYADRAKTNWRLTMPGTVRSWRLRLRVRDDRLPSLRADASPLCSSQRSNNPIRPLDGPGEAGAGQRDVGQVAGLRASWGLGLKHTNACRIGLATNSRADPANAAMPILLSVGSKAWRNCPYFDQRVSQHCVGRPIG